MNILDTKITPRNIKNKYARGLSIILHAILYLIIAGIATLFAMLFATIDVFTDGD